MSETEKSFRHLFSFGGADVRAPALAPAQLLQSVELVEADKAAPKKERFEYDEPVIDDAPSDVDNLSDPGDIYDEVKLCANNFYRGTKSVEQIRADWFDDGRQERLRADFKSARRRITKTRQGIKQGKGEVRL